MFSNLQEKVKDIVRVIDPAIAERLKKINDTLSSRFAVLCLSEIRDSILMWGHYSDMHRGIVIGFDSSNEAFHKSYKELGQVNYVRDRVLFDLMWTESKIKMEEFEEKFIFSKNEVWMYESEMRQMFRLRTLTTRLLKNKTLGYFMPIPPCAIVSVSLGAKCQKEVELRVRAALKKPEFCHVQFDRADLHESKFELVFVPNRVRAD